MTTEEALVYKKKWEASEENLQTLKKLAHVAIADYEDLQRKYDQNQKQYEELKKRLQDREEQIQSFQKYIEPAVDQYNELNTKYEIERGCRSEAETYASKIVKENNKLKRQSKMLLDKVTSSSEIKVEDLAEITEGSDSLKADEDLDKRVEHLNMIIGELQSQVATLQSKLSRAEADREDALEKERLTQQLYEQEVESHRRTQENLQQHDANLKKFKRVSTRAWDEFNNLKERYEKEKVLKETAEGYAHKMLVQKKAVMRESSVLLATAKSNEQLEKALNEIEALTKTLEEERRGHELKVKELEEDVATSRDFNHTSELETKLEEAMEQIEMLEKKIKENEDWKAKLLKENEDLTNQLDVANQKLNPPPPPAPPLPPGGFLKPLTRLVTRKKKPQPVGSPANDPSKQIFTVAIDEMMKRIKTGQTLKPVNKLRRPSLPDFGAPQEEEPIQTTAMSELNRMFTVIKRAPAPAALPASSDVLSTVKEEPLETRSELEKTYSRIAKHSSPKKLSLIAEDEEKEARASLSLSPSSSQNGTGHTQLELQESNTSTTL